MLRWSKPFLKNIGTSAGPAGFATEGRTQPRTGFMMMYKLIAASMLTLALGTSAIAQSSTTGTSGATTATPGATETMMMTDADKTLTKDWSGPIGVAFFTDDSMSTLKTQAEIQSGWASLSAEQQAQVKQDCASVSSSSTASTTGSGTSTDTTASGTTTTPSDTTASDTTTSGGTSTDTTASTSTDTTGPAAGTSTDTTASTSGSDTTTGSGTTSTDMATSGTAGSYSTAMTQLCSWVDSM